MKNRRTFRSHVGAAKRVLSFMLVFVLAVSLSFSFTQTKSFGAGEGTKTYTLHYENTSDWSEVSIYYWSTFNTGLSSWPGVLLTEDAEHEGYYTAEIELPAEETNFSVIFNNNGAGSQTPDIALATADGTELWISGTDVSYEAPEGWETTKTYTLHYENTLNWSDVSVYYWSTYNTGLTSWPGVLLSENAEHAGYYTAEIELPAEETNFNVIFNNNGAGSQTPDIALATADGTELWISGTAVSYEAPEGWNGEAGGEEEAPVIPEEITGPVVNADGSITFYLTGDYTAVDLMGTLNGTNWDGGLAMTKVGDVFTVTTPVQNPGRYEYKFRADGSNWFADPLNPSEGNSVIIVSGMASVNMEIQKGTSAALPETLELWTNEGCENVSVSYALAEEKAGVSIEDGKIAVAADFAGSKVEVKATAEKGGEVYTASIFVKVLDKTYTYNVYYYDPAEAHMSVDAADIWIWEEGGGNLSICPVSFSELVELEDGNTWLKATFETDKTNLGMIPRSKGTWSWQTGNHYYNNEEGLAEVDLYIVYNDDAHTYTSLPGMKEMRNRYVVVEYNRPANDYEGWNIYSWNSGFGSETEIYAKDVNGKMYITVPVKDTSVDFDLAFCMRRIEGENAWAEKDGGDHFVKVPADQLVVKAVFEQGKGITEVLPYNKGYEMDGSNSTIHFYYRDDAKFLDNTLEELEGAVSVVVNGETYAMEYDAEAERFFFDLKDAQSGEYVYSYVVNGEEVADPFNPEGKFTYKHFEGLEAEASLVHGKVSADKNDVLSVALNGADITAEEIKSVTADLSALGLGSFAIDPKLMEGTISCRDTVEAGVKEIPVTVADIYGNVYEAAASVEVTEEKAEDFSWDEAVIYFAVTDRFFDGSTANNEGCDKEGSLSYHGGDFAGLSQKLDELKALGVNTIWITPIVENSDVTTEKDGETIESTGYHGYWSSDFTKLNPHLGTEEEFKALLDAAHSKDMKIMVDVVLNHAGYNTEDYFNQIITDETGAYVKAIRDAESTVSGDDVYDSLAGLPDFMTENEAVRNQLISWQVDWMADFDVDYYRVDTVKHVDSTTWAAFKNALTKENPNFKMIGEYAGAGVGNVSTLLNAGQMDSLLDFDFNDFAVGFLSGNVEGIEQKLAERNGMINNTAMLGSFVNSHDEDSLQAKLQADANMTEEQTAALMKAAASLVITAKGQPVLYYGEEIGQYGLNNYPYQTNRYDYDWEELEAQKADADSLYSHYQKMLAIRNEYSDVFAKGSRATVAASNTAKYDVFTRSYGDTTLYVGMNVGAEAVEVTIPVAASRSLDTAAYKDLYSGAVYEAADGQVTVTIPAAADGGTVVLVKEEVEVPEEPTTPEETEPETEVPEEPATEPETETEEETVVEEETTTEAESESESETEAGVVDAPSTGDHTNAPLLAAIMVICMALAAAATVAKKKLN